MPSAPTDLVVRTAGRGDAGAIAALRPPWGDGEADTEADFPTRMAAWLADEGERRTTWLAELGGAPVGMASLLEYRPRLVLSPSADSVAFYRRAGFVVPDETAGADRLLVRRGRGSA